MKTNDSSTSKTSFIFRTGECVYWSAYWSCATRYDYVFSNTAACPPCCCCSFSWDADADADADALGGTDVDADADADADADDAVADADADADADDVDADADADAEDRGTVLGFGEGVCQGKRWGQGSGRRPYPPPFVYIQEGGRKPYRNSSMEFCPPETHGRRRWVIVDHLYVRTKTRHF